MNILRPNLGSFSVRLLFGVVALVLATTLSAGVPAYWLTRTQLNRQAQAQVVNMHRATESLVQAERERLASLALTFAERPTLEHLVLQQDTAALQPYLAAFQSQSTLDILLFCDGDGVVWAGAPRVVRCPISSSFADVNGQPAMLASAVVTTDVGKPLGISVRNNDEAIVEALELGADDYMVKPYSTTQLVARVRAVLRRSGTIPTPGLLELTNLTLDRARNEAQLGGGIPVRLTPLEVRLLEALMLNAGHVLPTDTLIDKAWGPEGGDRAMLKPLGLPATHQARTRRRPLYNHRECPRCRLYARA